MLHKDLAYTGSYSRLADHRLYFRTQIKRAATVCYGLYRVLVNRHCLRTVRHTVLQLQSFDLAVPGNTDNIQVVMLMLGNRR